MTFVKNNPGLCAGAALFAILLGLILLARLAYWNLTGVSDPLSALH